MKNKKKLIRQVSKHYLLWLCEYVQWLEWTDIYMLLFIVFPSLSRVRLFATPWTAARHASLSITNSRSSLKLTSIESVMPSSHLILGCPLLLLSPIPPSIRDFSNESTLRMRWPKYWSFRFSISPCNEYSGLISFRIDWFALPAVQGTLKSILQHHNLKASVFNGWVVSRCTYKIYMWNDVYTHTHATSSFIHLQLGTLVVSKSWLL